MTSDNRRLTLEAVLDIFQSEEVHDGDVLARYIQAYPQFTLELIDFSRLIATPDIEDETPLSGIEQSRVDAAWIEYKSIKAAEPDIDDPLARLTGDRGKALATKLGVPRQVVTCIRERKIAVSSMPDHILRSIADTVEVLPAHVIAAMQQPPAMAGGRSYKSSAKPSSGEQVTFEQVLIEAGVSAADRVRILADRS